MCIVQLFQYMGMHCLSAKSAKISRMYCGFPCYSVVLCISVQIMVFDYLLR